MAPNSLESSHEPSVESSAIVPNATLSTSSNCSSVVGPHCCEQVQDAAGDDSTSAVHCKKKPPKMGPEPTLLSRRQVDALYCLLEAVTTGLEQLEIPYILTGGSLLGAIRQHSILFCDDDIDLAILEIGEGSSNYERARSQLPLLLGDEYQYSVKPWEGGDKVRLKSCSNVFLDVFVIREYRNVGELLDVIGVKKNGEKQSEEYVRGIVDTINDALHSQGEIDIKGGGDGATSLELSCPMWHFNTRKAVEMWPKEVYREMELFPLNDQLKMGPVVGLSGPHTPVWLLKRAFGNDCFEVYYQSNSHGGKSAEGKHIEGDSAKEQADLPPLVAAGGQWETSVKAPLSDEHYVPMQPVSKAKRRHTLHGKSALFDYLASQSEREAQRLIDAGLLPNVAAAGDHDSSGTPARRTVYMDGVFDLFHIGHLHAIQQCAALGDRVIIGVTGDTDATGYKRRPIISQEERTAIVKSLKVVDDVVCPCPLVVTEEFMNEWGIDLVVHGFADPKDAEKQRVFFQEAMDQGKFQQIDYYSQLSTTDIIRKIQSDYGDVDKKDAPVKNGINPKWFGAALSEATGKSSMIPYDPFPLDLRNAIELHIRKATKKRTEALNAVMDATGEALYKKTLHHFSNSNLAREGSFDFDGRTYDLRERFLASCELPEHHDLAQLHESTETSFKDDMMFAFASNYHHFQQVYDEFVRAVCCPFVASLTGSTIDEVYYQSFPCVRVVRPGDFSIGPHADSAYGHHPCSINFYIPLTRIEGSASLFLESRPGSEDWHPITGEYGMVKHFAGALAAHWTPENNTDFTRVSLDFRIIIGPMFHALKCGGKQPGGVRDVYREKEGYYSIARKRDSDSTWIREGPLQTPDARFGFPWTKFKQAHRA